MLFPKNAPPSERFWGKHYKMPSRPAGGVACQKKQTVRDTFI
jgi:hypothetical protein